MKPVGLGVNPMQSEDINRIRVTVLRELKEEKFIEAKAAIKSKLRGLEVAKQVVRKIETDLENLCRDLTRN